MSDAFHDAAELGNETPEARRIVVPTIHGPLEGVPSLPFGQSPFREVTPQESFAVPSGALVL